MRDASQIQETHATTSDGGDYTLRPPSDAAGYALMFVSLGLVALVFVIAMASIMAEDAMPAEPGGIVYGVGIIAGLVMMIGFGVLLAFRRFRFVFQPGQTIAELVTAGIFGATHTPIPRHEMTATFARATSRQGAARKDYAIILAWPGGSAEVYRGRDLAAVRAEGQRIADRAGLACEEKLDAVWPGGRIMPVVVRDPAWTDDTAVPAETVFTSAERLAFGVLVAVGCLGMLAGAVASFSPLIERLTGIALGDVFLPPAYHAWAMSIFILQIVIADRQTFPGRRSVIRYFPKIGFGLMVAGILGMIMGLFGGAGCKGSGAVPTKSSKSQHTGLERSRWRAPVSITQQWQSVEWSEDQTN